MTSAADVTNRAANEIADEILARCGTLAAMSAMSDGICRVYLSDEHRAANAQAVAWMADAGMTTHIDAAGNARGRYAGATDNAPVLLIGSHLDTIPDAGAYDGILGVLLGISAVAQLHASKRRLPYAIEVIGFGEEEGVRFGTTLMTSRALAGTWDERWWQLEDAEGTSLHQAFENFGLNPNNIDDAALNKDQVLGYVEAHIEQGPVLEQAGLALGVVTAIAGAKRLLIRIDGQAGHAGTTPMNMRRDALVAASRAVARAEEIANRHGVVATVGQISAQPGGVNVIPRSAEFSLDIRSGDDTRRDAALKEFSAALEDDCESRNLQLQVNQTHAAAAVPCALPLQDLWAAALEDIGAQPMRLASGAGHDAMAMADICDVAMLFIRCTGGISHNPAEAVLAADVAQAVEAMKAFLERLAASTI